MKYDYHEAMKLSNQLCFPLYAAARNVTGLYTPYLKELGLTYTQYIAMMALWENECMNVRELGRCIFLDSGTLTPMLKKLENKGFISRSRSKEDERNLVVKVTDEGWKLRERLLYIPAAMSSCVDLDRMEAADLYRLLYKVLGVNAKL